MNEITVRAPATVANVVCGFDCLGFALGEPFDEITLRISDQPGVRIVHNDGFGLPVEPERNVVGTVLMSMAKAACADVGFVAEITKHIKPGSGIGSSAASAAGAAVAANHLLGERFTKNQLVEFARDGEFTACGSRIADNVSACIFGGFTLVRATEPVADVIALDFPELFVTVIHPQIEIKTADARAVMKQEVPLATAVRQWGNVGALVAGLAKGDYALIGRSLEDFVAEPYRKALIPHFDDLKFKSLMAGALGGGISGSGPSVFMLSASEVAASDVADAMRGVYSKSGIEFNIYRSGIKRSGVTIAE
ncbi:MAG: homoserine kinase [Acidobacteria bacterium]|nr:homoserine kinase [Acidobacteriota bacterium]